MPPVRSVRVFQYPIDKTLRRMVDALDENPSSRTSPRTRAGSKPSDTTSLGTDRRQPEHDVQRENLSQLLAKILDQLSLSAWLPAAALVSIIGFAVTLRLSDGDFNAAVDRIGHLGFVGLGLLGASVVVVTMLTQAFEFEAIRLLEGYWRPNRIAGRLGDLLSSRHARRRRDLARDFRRANLAAFKGARKTLRKDAKSKQQDGLSPIASERDLEIIELIVRGKRIDATIEESLSARAVPWRRHAPRAPLRQAELIGRRLKDFPEESRILPTRLGNILRAYEDSSFPSAGATLEGTVQRIFHSLPSDLQVEHDQSRSRLDLYCSMVVVQVVAAASTAGILWPLGSAYPLVTTGIGLLTSVVWYRAAVASARAYGLVLNSISSYVTD